MFGVYIHFPYCRKRCPYCDFAVHARQRIPHERYQHAVLAELDERAPLFAGRQTVSVYLGGGTPGLWEPACVGEVVRAVLARFPGAPEVEVTLEANPDELPLERLEGYRSAGVNRLSLGVQSLQPKHLQTLGRLHGPDEPREAVRNARRAGFTSLSLDLMFGLPGQTLAELDLDLDGLVAMEPDHLSIYNLTIEERTAFGALARKGTLKVPDNGLCADLYARVIERVTGAGFRHYEISSFARPGRQAVHNTLYWTGGEYLGLGSSASSFRRVGAGGERFSTVKSVDDYYKSPAIAQREELDAAALEREAVWLGLRFLDGIDRAAHARLYGADPIARHADEIARLTREGLVLVSADRLRLTPRGILFADEVGARFL
jgi:oxygen-independent coproporphyrinogen-3 oxidase